MGFILILFAFLHKVSISSFVFFYSQTERKNFEANRFRCANPRKKRDRSISRTYCRCQSTLGLGSDCLGKDPFHLCSCFARSTFLQRAKHPSISFLSPVLPCGVTETYLNFLIFFSETLIKRTMGYILALIKSFVQPMPSSSRQCLFCQHKSQGEDFG